MSRENVSFRIHEVSSEEEVVRQKVGALQKEGARVLIVIGIADSVPMQMQWQKQSLDQEGTFLKNWLVEEANQTHITHRELINQFQYKWDGMNNPRTRRAPSS